MIIISKGNSNIKNGLQKVIELENELKQSWESQIKDAMNVANAEYYSKVKQWETECLQITEENDRRKGDLLAKANSKKPARNVVGLLFILVIGLLPFFFWGWLLSLSLPNFFSILFTLVLCVDSLFCVICPIIFLSLFFEVRSLEKMASKPAQIPKKPIMPYSENPLSWLNLRQQWQTRLGIRAESDNHGMIGENRLVQSLKNYVTDDYLCVTGILVTRNLDADVIVIGPKGIWLFESKYVSGKITLLHGQWSRYKEYYLPGGHPVHKEEVLDSFDEQWLREKKAIQKTLSKRLQDPYFQPLVEDIKGGLVFTHDNIILDIDKSAKAPYGNINFWIMQLTDSRPIFPLSNIDAMEVADILINYSNQLDVDKPLSSIDIATDIFLSAEKRIKSYCDKYSCSYKPTS